MACVAGGLLAVVLAAPADAATTTTVRVKRTTALARDVGAGLTVDIERFSQLDINGGTSGVSIDVRLRRGEFIVRTTRGPVAPGSRCRRTGMSTIACSARDVKRLIARLGSGNDRLDLHSVSAPEFGARVLAGAGNDTLIAPKRGATLSGGAGNDTLFGSRAGDDLSGGPERDAVFAGRGNDLIRDGDGRGRPARDVYDGGLGRDQLSYGGPEGVTIDLAARRGGAAGEADALTRIEDATGGTGDDTLIGDAGSNVLSGGRGRDRMSGGGGGDTLRTVPADSPTNLSFQTAFTVEGEIFGSAEPDDPRPDTLPADTSAEGGDGDDQVSLAGGHGAGSTQVGCGAGADRILRSDPAHLLGSDCESVVLPGLFPGAWIDTSTDEVFSIRALLAATISSNPTLQGTNAVFSVSCPSNAQANEPPGTGNDRRLQCTGFLDVDGSRASFNLAPGAQQQVVVPLSAADAARLGAGFQARVSVILTSSAIPSGATPPPIGWTINLRS